MPKWGSGSSAISKMKRGLRLEFLFRSILFFRGVVMGVVEIVVVWVMVWVVGGGACLLSLLDSTRPYMPLPEFRSLLVISFF